MVSKAAVLAVLGCAVRGSDRLAGAGLLKGGRLAAVPPAGWTSWNTAGCQHLSQAFVEAQMTALTTPRRWNGTARTLHSFGYDRVNVDDC